MNKEKLSSISTSSEIQIEESEITAFNRENSEKYSFRVYKDGIAGIKFVKGKINDDDGFRAAEENLALKRPYKFELESGSRHRDKTEKEYSDKELMETARETLNYLKKNYPDFTYTGSVSKTKKTVSAKNDVGMDYSDTDCTMSVGVRFKHKDSKDIYDGYFGLSKRVFDLKEFTDMADNYLSHYCTPAELPEEMIIQVQYYGLLAKIRECLDAEKIALGASLFSGKIGEKLFSDRFTVLHDVSDKETWHNCFFDGDGAVLPDDKYTYIKNGVLLTGYADKRTADKYGVKSTGSAVCDFSDTPSNGNVNLRIERSDKTVKELLDGRLSVVPMVYSGGGFNDKGDYAMPVQKAYLCDGGKFLGVLPEFTLSGNMYDMFSDDFIGVGSDDPIFSDKQILLKMKYNTNI